MAARTNYGFQKRQKEIKRQKKREEKAERKRLKKEAAAEGDQGEVVEGGGGDLESANGLPSDDDRDGGDSGDDE